MTDMARLLRALPKAMPVLEAIEKAAHGDQQSVDYLRRQGWADALDAMIRPGTGEVAQQAAKTMLAFLRGDVVDGEFRDLDGPPWSGFVKRLWASTSGGHILIGPMGEGKTTLAVKMARQWQEHLGYKVESVSMYGEDVPDFASVISVETLTKRMRRLRAWLRSQEVEDEDGLEPDPAETKEAEKEAVTGPPPGQRVVIIDEAGLSMSNTAMDPGRRAALQALAQSRHLGWQVLYIAQWTGQLPLPLLGLSTVWVKKPHGNEADTDRDNRLVRQIWLDATEAFEGLHRSHWYGPPWEDMRSWAYVRCLSLNGKPGYTGLVPFRPYGSGEPEDAA